MNDEKILEGIRKTIENSQSLYEDSLLLKLHGRKERAYSLFQISIEETGKAFALYHLLLTEDFKNPELFKAFLKNFRDHKYKTRISINIDTIIARIIDDTELRTSYIKSFIQQHESISLINDMKNYSLYVSHLNDKFVSPSSLITDINVDSIEFLASSRLNAIKQLYPIFEQTLETVRPLFQKQMADKNQPKLTNEITNESLK